MEQQLPLSHTNNGATPPVRRSHKKYEGRIDHEHTMLVIAEVFARKPEGFTIPDVQQWFKKDDGRMPSDTVLGDILNTMVVERLAERLNKCRDRFRLYRIVKSDAVQTAQAPVSVTPKVGPIVPPPLVEAENQLDVLDALGIDTKKARLGLEKALEIKAQLEALAKS